MKLLLQILGRIVPAIILVASGYLGYQYMQTEPERSEKKRQSSPQYKRKGATRKIAGNFKKAPKGFKIKGLKSKFLSFVPEDYQIQLNTQGIVKAPQATTLSFQVSGKILSFSDAFATGAFVKKGEILAQIDPSDYQANIISAEAQLARAQANLAQEAARGEQALRNWKQIGYHEEPNDLVLRKPQLREAAANVRSAEASLAKARRNLERCFLKAPFSGVIRNRIVGIGSIVGGNTKMGEILATDFAEVRIPLNQNQLEQLNKSGNLKPEVLFTNALQTENPQSWKGKIERWEGEMDLASRELHLIAKIQDPFGLSNSETIPLSFNQPVLASVPGLKLKNVYVINREHIIGLSEIVTIYENRIKRIKLNPVWEDQQSLIVEVTEIPKGAVLATSRMEYAAEGAKVTMLDEKGDPVNSNSSKGSNPATASSKLEKSSKVL